MPDETNRQDTVKDTPAELPADNKPADVKEQTEVKEGSLPEDAKERTKAEFEKLTKVNRELKAELEAKAQPKKSVLDSLRPEVAKPVVAPPAPNQGKSVDETVDSLVDAEGYVDTARLKQTLQESDQRTAQAVAKANKALAEAQQASRKVSHFAETEEMKEVHKAYPTLNPESKTFDPVFFDLVRDRVIRQMTEGKQDVYLAAQEISEVRKSDTEKAKEAEEVKATTTAKEQINASGSSAPARETSHEELVKGTMQGDRKSLYERMKKSGN